MSPLRTRAGLWSGEKFRSAADRLAAAKARRVAKISAAAVMVLGVGTASAFFVDYLADRAISRTSSILEVEPLVTAAVAEAASISAVTEAEAAPIPQEPAAPAVEANVKASAQPVSTSAEPAPPKPMPIEAVLPDAAAIAKVAVGPEHAIELPTDDPTDEPLVSAYSGDTGPDEASEEITAAISPDESEPEPIPGAVAKPRKAKAEKSRPAAQSKDTEIASLPGVDVGGMAGHPSADDGQSASKVRTVTREKAAAGRVAAGTARVRQAVNMRSAPKKGAGVLGVVPSGTSVSVLSCESWCQISYKGRKGWVYKSFLAAAPKKEATAEPKKPAPRVPSNRS
jgi:hypothetical protein